MTEPSAARLPQLIETFFRDYLQRVRGASRLTVRSYRDSIRLLLCFLADSQGRKISTLTLDDFTADRVLTFLDHLEVTRKNCVATRNQRLAAIRSLTEHFLRYDPTRAGQYRKLLDIPTKKARIVTIFYLEPEEVRAIIRQPDRGTAAGRMQHALILFLYNTGARVSEALAVRPCDLELGRPSQVRLLGKGNKERICPLWRDTADALTQLISCGAIGCEHRIFLNARGRPLSRDGVAYHLRKHARVAARELPRLAQLAVTPHVIRHSCAVALLQAGVDLIVIRDYLGHASVATTNRYLSTNLQSKREVLELFWEKSGLATAGSAEWHPAPDILAFLESL
jgi:site-specific recombinase XerD